MRISETEFLILTHRGPPEHLRAALAHRVLEALKPPPPSTALNAGFGGRAREKAQALVFAMTFSDR
jgi:hypothetical protein